MCKDIDGGFAVSAFDDAGDFQGLRQRGDGVAELFGDLADNERFVSTYTSVLASLHSKGARATLDDLASAS